MFLNEQFHFEKFIYFNGSIFKPSKAQREWHHWNWACVWLSPCSCPYFGNALALGFTTCTQTYLQTHHSLFTSFAHILANLLLWNGWIIVYFFSNLFLLSIDLTPKKFSLQPPSPLEWGMEPLFSPPPLQPPSKLEWFWDKWTFPPNCEPLFPLGEPFSSFSSNFLFLWNGWNF